MLDTGFWLLDTGHWLLNTGYWMLDTRIRLNEPPHRDEGIYKYEKKAIQS